MKIEFTETDATIEETAGPFYPKQGENPLPLVHELRLSDERLKALKDKKFKITIEVEEG